LIASGKSERADGWRRFLPAPDSARYHLLLGVVAIAILGPLGGVTTAYMNFSLGTWVPAQLLAGILGSTVTYGYGPDGKHGANYIQTMAASVGSMSAMSVLVQAMVWLGLPLPPAWQLMLFVGCVGMFGVGVGMLCTPILVDRLQLEYPSGHAVANILRALTDKRLLRRSVGKLGGGTGLGVVAAALADKVRLLGDSGLSASTVGAGMIVGSRIAVPAIVMGGVLQLLSPHLRAIGWLGPRDPFRKLGFLIALAMIMGAAIVDLTLIGVETARQVRARWRVPAAGAPARPRLSTSRVALWVAVWGALLLAVATRLLHQPPGFILFAMALTMVFVFVNGIATGVSDQNPISAAFVVAVLLMSGLGLKDPVVGLMAASILLISCNVGVDMQQDRSTGWRLGTDRALQFRYQVVGIIVGAVLCVALATLFMAAYPELRIDTFAHPEARTRWQSAMTFKLVGAIRDVGHLPAHKVTALEIGLCIGLFTQIARRSLTRSTRYRAFIGSSRRGRAAGWLVDAVLLPSPYASSFGGFLSLSTSAWFATGGVISSVFASVFASVSATWGQGERQRSSDAGAAAALPADMSTMSLFGGGLIAGESLFALVTGVVSLIALM
jgi:uncharacterized oligopeptide transporter (OPT) family protein